MGRRDASIELHRRPSRPTHLGAPSRLRIRQRRVRQRFRGRANRSARRLGLRDHVCDRRPLRSRVSGCSARTRLSTSYRRVPGSGQSEGSIRRCSPGGSSPFVVLRDQRLAWPLQQLFDLLRHALESGPRSCRRTGPTTRGADYAPGHVPGAAVHRRVRALVWLGVHQGVPRKLEVRASSLTPRWLGRTAAPTTYGISLNTLDQLRAVGKVRAKRVGGSILVEVAMLDEWVENLDDA